MLDYKNIIFCAWPKIFIANQGGRRVAKIGLPSYSSLQQIKEVKIDCLRMYGLALTTTEAECVQDFHSILVSLCMRVTHG